MHKKNDLFLLLKKVILTSHSYVAAAILLISVLIIYFFSPLFFGKPQPVPPKIKLEYLGYEFASAVEERESEIYLNDRVDIILTVRNIGSTAISNDIMLANIPLVTADDFVVTTSIQYITNGDFWNPSHPFKTKDHAKVQVSGYFKTLGSKNIVAKFIDQKLKTQLHVLPKRGCYDADGGLKYRVKSWIKLQKEQGYRLEDECIDSEMLYEQTCVSNNASKTIMVLCAYGCRNGRCLEEREGLFDNLQISDTQNGVLSQGETRKILKDNTQTSSDKLLVYGLIDLPVGGKGAPIYPRAQSFTFKKTVQVHSVAFHMQEADNKGWKVRILSSLPRKGSVITHRGGKVWTFTERGPVDSASMEAQRALINYTDLKKKTLGYSEVSHSSVGWVNFYFSNPILLQADQEYFLFIDSNKFGDGPNSVCTTSISGEQPGPYPNGTGWIFVYNWSDNSNYKLKFKKHVDYAHRIYYSIP